MFEKILERLEELKEYDLCNGMLCMDCEEKYGGDGCGTRQQSLAIDECKAIVQEVAKDGGWIPCSERLPEENGRFLVTDEDGILAVCRFVADENEFRVCWDNEYFLDAIAWQPLPAPYQKGE